jgi:hypothetical protein
VPLQEGQLGIQAWFFDRQRRQNGGVFLVIAYIYRTPTYRESKESVMGRYSNGLQNVDAARDLGLKSVDMAV